MPYLRMSGWAALIVFLGLNVQTGKGEDKPNILFMFSDDHALRTIGAYGSGFHETPNIDRIATEGAVFTRSYCVNSICCPSRAAILTGKHSHANGITGNGSKWNGQQWVFPRELAKAGYQTALIGKWHLVGNPTDEFNHWEILSGKGGQGSYFNPEFLSASGTSTVEGHSSDIITDKAISWLKQRDTFKPFLLCAQYKAPHIHRLPPPRFMGRYDGVEIPEPNTLFDDHSTRQPFVKDVWMFLHGMKGHVLNIGPTKEEIAADPESMPPFLKEMTVAQRDAWHTAYDSRNLEMRRLQEAGLLEGQAGVRYTYQRFIKDYLRCVDGLDDNIGRLLDHLDKAGLKENTIVVYASDQGFFTGEHGWAEKRWMYEESFQYPLLMRWPGTIKHGSRISALTQNIDLAPTFLTAAGVRVPKEVHGLALQPVLGGTLPESWRKDILYEYYEGGIPRVQPGSYNMPRHEGVRDDRYKLIHFYDHNAWEFYDLKSDPRELVNRYSDPAVQSNIERLKGRLAALKEQFGVPKHAEIAPRKKHK